MSATRIGQNGMLIRITEKNSPCSLRYLVTPCQFSKLYFHYFFFIPLIRVVEKLMREILAIQICNRVQLFFPFFSLLIAILLKDRVRNGVMEDRDTERGCVSRGACKGKSCRLS